MVNKDNRSKILWEALKLFSDKGYDAVGVQKIVETCGVTKPTLYHYFGNKVGLLNAIFEEHFTTLKHQLLQVSEYNHDITKNLKDFTRVCFDYARNHREFYRLQLNMYFSPPHNEVHKVVIVYNTELHNILEKLFESAEQDHGNFRGRKTRYSATFLGMINTYIGIYLNDLIDLNEDVLHLSVHQFMHGIFS